jgi:hypothetical protein
MQQNKSACIEAMGLALDMLGLMTASDFRQSGVMQEVGEVFILQRAAECGSFSMGGFPV